MLNSEYKVIIRRMTDSEGNEYNRIKRIYYSLNVKQSGKSLIEYLKELKSIGEGISEGIRK